MIAVNQTYTDLVAAGAQFEWRINNGSNTWTSANIMSGTITQTLFDSLSIGNTISTQLDISLWDVTVDTSHGLVVQFRATDGSSSSSWYTKGTFFIDTMETSPYSEITKITAFDSMLKSEYVYQVRGSWTSPTDLTVLNKICGTMGVTLASATQTLFTTDPWTLTNPPNIGTDGTTAREMLSYIGAMRGGNWRMTPGDKLQLILLSDAPANTANIGDAVSDFDASPVETVSKVRVWISDDEYYAFPDLPITDHALDPIKTHSNNTIDTEASANMEEWEQISGRCLDITIPFWCDYALAKALFTQFSGKSFQPYVIGKAFIPPEYEIGDGLTVLTSGSVTSQIASQAIEISPLAPSSAELKKEEVINSLYPYKNPYKRKTDYHVAMNSAAIQRNSEQIASTAETVAELPNLIYQQTELISGGFGGYIKFNKLPDGSPSEMLVMDTPDEATATNLIRLNMNGLGFSTDGGTTYANAWTIDGKLNADFIQSGTIADDILNPNNYWNLQTGDFVTKQGQIGNFYINATSLYSGSLGVGETGTEINPGMFTQVQYLPNNITRRLDIYGGIIELSGAFAGDVNFKTSLNIQTIDDTGGNPIASFVNGSSETAMYICTNPSDGYRVKLFGGVNISGGVHLAAGTTITIGSSGGVLEFH